MTDYDPADDGAHGDFSATLSYSSYLKLDAVLTAQHPLSDAHDEMLFIIQHQTSELWLKLAIHELICARSALLQGTYDPAFKMLARVARIFEQLNTAWDVLRTMTPSDYTEFRKTLGKSSGFQSAQYRKVEFILGNRNTKMLRPFSHMPDMSKWFEDELEQPSLYDVALLCLERDGLDITSPRQAWLGVYAAPQTHWSHYQLAEKLVDLEDYMRRWRFNHVTTVERIIGAKTGTGGTSGVAYLKKMLDIVMFPDLWDIRSEM